MNKHIAVLMGGLSAENKVSENSGKNVCKALDNLGYKYSIVDPCRKLATTLSELKPDVVFNALHGTYGEDGTVPGILEMLGIPYTHSGVMASAIGLNKEMTKKIVSSYGVRVPEGFTAHIEDVVRGANTGKHVMKPPYVVKPLQQGSTIGVHIVHNQNDKINVTPSEWKFGDIVMVEQYIPGMELSTAVLGDKAIGNLEIIPASGFNDYEAKYTVGKSEHVYPARMSKEAYAEALKFSEIAHKAIGCRSLSRSDFRYDKDSDGKVYFLEINTHPGLTSTSIVPDIIKPNNISMENLVDILIKEAKCELKP
jgi:D-alanine-D-alanine ligase